VEVTGDSSRSVTMNVLNADGTTVWNPTIQASQHFVAPSWANLRGRFHRYGFEWLPTGITWYLDGEIVGHHSPEHLLKIPDLSAKIVMNLWVFREEWGYAFGGREGKNNAYPMYSEYDWLRFYKWDGDAQYPCEGASTSCLTEDDRFFSSNNPCDGIPQEGGVPPCVAECAREKSPQELGADSSASQREADIFFP